MVWVEFPFLEDVAIYSISHEIEQLAISVLSFVFNLSIGWILLVTVFFIVTLIMAIFLRVGDLLQRRMSI